MNLCCTWFESGFKLYRELSELWHAYTKDIPDNSKVTANINQSKYTVASVQARKGDVHKSFGGSTGRSNVESRVGSEIPTSEVSTMRLEQKHITEAEAGLQDWEGLCSSFKTRPHKLDSEFLHPAQIPGWLSLTPVWLIGLIPGQCLAKSPTACLNAPRRRTRGQETQYFQSSCTIARWLQRDSLGLCASVASVPRRSWGYACQGDRAVVVVRAATEFLFSKAVWCSVVHPPSPLHHEHVKPTSIWTCTLFFFLVYV